MTDDPHRTPDITPEADPADVLEQETLVEEDGEAGTVTVPGDIPIDANEADVIEQHQEVPEEPT